jgi:hypothetical protein
MWAFFVYKGRRLNHVYVFLQVSQLPPITDCNGQDKTNCGWLDNRTEGCGIVEPWSLVKAFGH